MEQKGNFPKIQDGGIGRENRFSAWFLVLALISGLLIAYFTPPMCSPDENAHFLNAYAVSRGDFLPQVVDNTPGRYVEERVLSFIWKYNDRFHGNLAEKYSFAEQYYNSYLNDENTALVFSGSVQNTINPIGYLPAGITIALGRFLGNLFSFSLVSLPYNLLLFGRLGNLLFYSIVTYLALRRAVCFRRVMFILALMPITLFLGSSLNYDAILISVCFLFIAEVGRLLTDRSDKVISNGDIACVLLCTFFLVGIKQVYATLLLMLLAIPKKKYGSTKRMLICVGLVLLTGIIAYLPVVVINNRCRDVVNESTTPYILAQTEYVKMNLAEMPKVFLNTVSMFKSFYLDSFWGNLGQLDTNIPVPFTMLFYCLLLLLSVTDVLTTDLWDRQWKRVLPFSATIISVIGIFGALYLSWTPLPGIAEGVGSSYVSGVQGRYLIELFIPAISVLCFARFADRRFVRRLSLVSDRFAYAWSVVCGLLTPIIIYARYWC